MRPSYRERDIRKYYDTYEFDRLHKLIDTDIYAAKEGFEEYLLKYNQDMAAYARYASILISLRELDNVEKIFNMIEYKLSKDSVYKEDPIKGNALKATVIYNRARLYAFQNKTWDALHIIFNNPEVFENLDRSNVFYLRSLVNNNIDRDRRGDNSYIYRQIIEYNEDDFLDHIKKHNADFNGNDRSISTSYFIPDFPYEKVIEEAKKNLKIENALNDKFMSNVYAFKYDGCGRNNNKIADYFEIVTFNNTNNIITMYPTTKPNNRNLIDLNYMKEKEEEKEPVKTISQIDKFYKRYNK